MRINFLWALIIATLPVIIKRPLLGLMIYVSMNIVRPEMLVWGGRSLSKSFIVIFIATSMGMVFQLSKYRLKTPFNDSELFLFLWFYCGLILSIFLSDYNLSRSFYYANEVGKIVIVVAMLRSMLNSKDDINKFGNILFFSILFLGIWAFDQHFKGNVRLEGLGGDAYPDSNGVASMFVLFFPITLVLLFDTSKVRFFKFDLKGLVLKCFGLLSSGVLMLAIVFTQSRGGLLGLIFSILYYVIVSKQKIKKLIILFIGGSVAVLFLPDYTLDRYSSISQYESEAIDYSAGSRIVLSLAGIEIFKDNFFFGSGFLTFAFEKMRYKEILSNRVEPDLLEYSFQDFKVGHNTYVQILAEGGLFTFLPYSILLLCLFFKNISLRRKIRLKKENENDLFILNGIEAGIWGHCLCNLFIGSISDILLFVQIFFSSALRDYLIENRR